MVNYSVLCKEKNVTLVPMTVRKSDTCAVIQFLTLENVSGHEICRCLCAAYKNPKLGFLYTAHK